MGKQTENHTKQINRQKPKAKKQTHCQKENPCVKCGSNMAQILEISDRGFKLAVIEK